MTVRIAACLFLLSAAAAAAQGLSAQDSTQQEKGPHHHLLRDPYVTSSGATVDEPGKPQGSAPTSLDRSIRKQDDAIDGSLCKGC